MSQQGMDRAWPAGGEIDILEGVNSVSGNTYSAHTMTGCTLTSSSTSGSTGLLVTEDCQYQPGCSYKDRVNNSFGPAFNSAGGGVVASYFDNGGIKVSGKTCGHVARDSTSVGVDGRDESLI